MQCLVQSIVRELLSAANLRTIISVSAATTAQKLITLASRAEQTLGAAGRDLAHSVEQAVHKRRREGTWRACPSSRLTPTAGFF